MRIPHMSHIALKIASRARLPSLRTLSDRSRMARTCSIVEDALQFVVVQCLADRLPRAVANLLEICNDFERPTISDIFTVKDWGHGQPLTIIRPIFMNDVFDG